MNFRSQFAGRDFSRYLVLLLLALGVVAPAASVLWFMNEAMTNQRDAARQKLAEAYRGQLQLLRDKLDADWEKRVTDLDRLAASQPAPAAFDRAVRDGLADAVIVLSADGSVAYPSASAAPPAAPLESRPDWIAAQSIESQGFLTGAAESYARIAQSATDPSLAARAMQASIRCLARGGRKNEALQAIQKSFSGMRRPIAAYELLLALSLLDRSDPRYAATAQQLRDLAGDYSIAIPAPQRLFLMDELHGDFPTYEAERLAAQFLDARQARSGGAALEPTSLANIWKLSPAGGRIVALYRTTTVLAEMRRLIADNGAFDVAPPSSERSAAWTNISDRFPGWRVTDPTAIRALAAAGPRISRYLWIALVAIAVVLVVALIAGHSLRRQWQLTRLKTDLLAAVSHELRTPLAAVRLLVETLLEDERPEGKTREYLEMIARENLRLSRMIGNFLTFSRLERNLRRFDIRATDPRRVVESVVASAQDRLHASDCRLEVEMSTDLPTIRADEDALVTVLLNLLDNAYKYSPGEKRICLRANRQDGHVVFAVEDHGIGIAAREHKRIFRRFYQVDRRLARESGGVGLGLSIVEFIVRAHGGSVLVESQPGKGSTFSVVLP